MKTNFYGLTIFYKALTLLALLSLLSVQTALAQSPEAEPVVFDPELEFPFPLVAEPEANTPGAVSCFDYHAFGSVQVNVSPFVETAYTTDVLYFAGEITNNNPYPLIDGQVWMRMFKLGEETNDSVVDFVLIEDNISLLANEVRPLDFEWTVPTYAAEGNYASGFLFTTASKYSFSGLSSAEWVMGNLVTFEVKSAAPYSPITFATEEILLNDRISNSRVQVRFGESESVTANATLVNDSAEEKRVSLTWAAYKWDGLQKDSIQDTKTEMVQIPANDSIKVFYDTPTLETAVTFIEAEVIDGDAKSMLNIRYIRDGIVETRINYPSTLTYPLTEGQEATMFSCVHSTSQALVSGNTVNLKLKDVNGNTLHSYTYEGDVTGALLGLKDSFVPERSYGSFSLTVSLNRDGQLVEEVITTYNCEDLDPSLCTEADKIVTAANAPTDSDDNQMLMVLLVVLLLLILAGLVYYKLSMKKASSIDDKMADDLGDINNHN